MVNFRFFSTRALCYNALKKEATDAMALSQAVEKNLPDRDGRDGLTREELAVLFAAMLTEA